MRLGRLGPRALVAVVACHLLVGFFWFGVLFGERWLSELRRLPNDFQSPSPLPLLFALGSAALSALLIDRVLISTRQEGLWAGLRWGFLLSLCTVFGFALTRDSLAAFDLSLGLLEAGEQVLVWSASGALVGALREPPSSESAAHPGADEDRKSPSGAAPSSGDGADSL